MATFERVLVATDFSETSRAAVDLASSIAAECGAALTVLFVCEVPGYAGSGPIPYDTLIPSVEAAQGKLDDILAGVRRTCPDAHGLVKVGAPAQEILATIAETRADLVVLGTHGRRGIAHALLGSVAERVVRLSSVPVLTVRSGRGE
jgi:nucleotide-binding universal stress UspA family protein